VPQLSAVLVESFAGQAAPIRNLSPEPAGKFFPEAGEISMCMFGAIFAGS
jgi:hypothetical protein